MKMEVQVSSPKLSIMLRDLGVEQDGHFIWAQGMNDNDPSVLLVDGEISPSGKIASAFTVAELGDMLPHKINDGQTMCGFWVNKFSGKHIWMVGYGSMKPACEFGASTEADARAKMLIHLIEKGIVKVGG